MICRLRPLKSLYLSCLLQFTLAGFCVGQTFDWMQCSIRRQNTREILRADWTSGARGIAVRYTEPRIPWKLPSRIFGVSLEREPLWWFDTIFHPRFAHDIIINNQAKPAPDALMLQITSIVQDQVRFEFHDSKRVVTLPKEVVFENLEDPFRFTRDRIYYAAVETGDSLFVCISSWQDSSVIILRISAESNEVVWRTNHKVSPTEDVLVLGMAGVAFVDLQIAQESLVCTSVGFRAFLVIVELETGKVTGSLSIEEHDYFILNRSSSPPR